MINKPKDWDSVAVMTERAKLPVGAYKVKIIGAKEKEYAGSNGSFSKLEIAFDIADGEYKDFYKSDFEAQQSEDKKWKGVLRLYVPTDDGSDRDATTKSILKSNMQAIEDSNPKFTWEWDETKLKGLSAGCLFRNEEWVMGDKSGWKAQPFKFISLDALKNGKFTLPKDKPNKNKPVSTSSPSVAFEEIPAPDDDDLPF